MEGYTMGKVVEKTGIKREDGWLYYIDKKGNVARVNMKRKGKPYKKKTETLAKVGIQREKGFLYYLDKQGNVSKAKMARR
jgi:glucan-binding YG repeat protein